MNKKMIIFFWLILFVPYAANAVVIVDTGSGGSGSNSWSLDSNQWLASEFTTSQDYSITSIEGYLSGSGSITAAIYTDGGNIPGSELFSTQFSVNTNLLDWYGPSVSWLLSSGTYWISYEVRAGDTFNNSFANYASTPLANEAFTSGGTWSEFDSLNLGWRISADSVGAVPEPTSLALLGLGLAGIGFSRKKKTS